MWTIKHLRLPAMAAAPIALLAVACAGEALAFDYNWHYSWRGDTKPSSKDIGRSFARTCFLSGMTGQLPPYLGPVTVQNPAEGSAWSTVTHAVGVRITNFYLPPKKQTYTLFVNPGTSAQMGVPLNRPLAAYAGCVSSSAARTPEVEWKSGSAKVPLAPPEPTLLSDALHPKRRCFLTEITATAKFIPGATVLPGFSAQSDFVKVWQDPADGKWYLGGEQSGKVSAKARCIDVREATGTWEFGGPGGRQELRSSTGGWNCFLTRIRGSFTTNQPAWKDGVYITYEPGTGLYYLNTSDGKDGGAMCVR